VEDLVVDGVFWGCGFGVEAGDLFEIGVEVLWGTYGPVVLDIVSGGGSGFASGFASGESDASDIGTSAAGGEGGDWGCWGVEDEAVVFIESEGGDGDEELVFGAVYSDAVGALEDLQGLAGIDTEP